MKKQNNRRQFLKNTSLGAVALGLSGKLSAKSSAPQTGDECPTTTLDYYGEGPFYTDNPPTIANNVLASADEPGERIIISGRVFNLDCTEFLPNTTIDVWHANDAGDYDNQGFNLRGITTSNEQGFYMFETIRPGKYLNGGTFRPSHIHFKIQPPGFDLITTQLYFEGDTSIAADPAASNTSETFDATHRIIPLEANTNGVLEGTWDIRVNGDGIGVGINDLHIDKGMFYETFPNPFSDRLVIKYGVFREAQTSIAIYNLNGQMVSELEARRLTPEKYEAVWEPDSSLPNGHYFATLKINDLQVHYMKVQKIS